MAFDPNKTQLDLQQILQQVYNPVNNSLAVDIQATVLAPSGQLDIAISADADTIRIGDGTKNISIGQQLMTNSFPVVIASNQSALPVTLSGTSSVKIFDSSGNNLNSTSNALNSFITNSTLAVTQSTSPWTIAGTVTANAGTGTFLVDGSTHTQPISAAALPLPAGAATSVNQTAANTSLSSIDNKLTSPLTVIDSPTSTTVSGSVTGDGVIFTVDAAKYTVAYVQGDATAYTGLAGNIVVECGVDNVNWNIIPTILSAVPIFYLFEMGMGFGGPGVVVQGKFEVQGRYLRVRLEGSGGSGTITATAFLRSNDAFDTQGRYNVESLIDDFGNPLDTTSRGLSINLRDSAGTSVTLGQKLKATSLPVVIPSDQTVTISGSVTQGTSPWVTSGTVTANIGTTNGLALDSSVNGILLTQGSTTSGQSGPLVQTATTTNAPTYTTAKSNPISSDVSGNIRVSLKDSPANTNKFLVTADPITGTVTANAGTGNFTVVQSTAANLNATVSGTVTANIGTSGSLALDASVVALQVAQASSTTSQKGTLIQGAVTTNAPSYTTAQTNPLSLDTSGLLRVSIKDTPQNTTAFKVDGSAVTQPTLETRPATPSVTNVNSSASSVSLLASTASRRAAYFYNDSTANLYLKMGTTASTSSFTVKIPSQGFFEIPQPCYTGAVDGIWDSANGAVRITELT